MVITFAESFHVMAAPKVSTTKRKGTIVRLFTMMGTTLVLLRSMGFLTPFTMA